MHVCISVVVAPTSLVSNWKQEIAKWLGPRLTLIALSETTREQVLRSHQASMHFGFLFLLHFLYIYMSYFAFTNKYTNELSI